jgi:hypothetical protein
MEDAGHVLRLGMTLSVDGGWGSRRLLAAKLGGSIAISHRVKRLGLLYELREQGPRCPRRLAEI